MAEPEPRVRPEREAAKSDYHGMYHCRACEVETWVVAQDEIKCWKCQTEVMYKKVERIDQSLVPEGAEAGVPATIVEVPVAYHDAQYICANCGEENDVKVPSDERPTTTRWEICCWKCHGTVLYKKRTGRIMEYQAR